MKKLRYITDFLKLNGKYILLLLPIVLHQAKVLDFQIISNLCLLGVLWCVHRYEFSVYRYEDKKIDYIFFGALTFYLSYVEFAFSIFSILVAVHFMYQKIRLKKYWAMTLFWLGAATPIALCIYQYDTVVAMNLFDKLWAYYPNFIPNAPQEYVLIFAGVFIFIMGLLNRFYMLTGLILLAVSFATGIQSLILSAVLIAGLSFLAKWKIEKRIG